MGIVDKFKDLVGIEEIEDDDYYEDDYEEVQERNYNERNRYGRSSRDSIVPITPRATSALKMIVIEPTGFEEAPKLVDSLKEKKPIIINLEKMNGEIAKKIFDFLSGATYALNGHVQKITSNIFLFVPHNVDISSNDTPKTDFATIHEDIWK